MKDSVLLWARRLRREPAIVLTVIVSLALPLAGTIVALSSSSAVLWRALPFDNANRLVTLGAITDDGESRWMSLPELGTLEESSGDSFTAICGYTVADFTALADAPLRAQSLLATVITPQFFDVFRIRPALGTLPVPDNYVAGERVVLLSHQLWLRRYGGAPDIVGRHIGLAGPGFLPGADGTYRVIGVLPSDFWLFWKQMDILVPARFDSEATTDANNAILEHVVARLGDRTDSETARNRSGSLLAALARAGASQRVASINISGLQAAHYRTLRPQLLAILATAAAVLALATINIVRAAVAQAISRKPECAIRLALGGPPSRLLREAIYNQAISIAVAGAIGIVSGLWLARIVATRSPGSWLAQMPGAFAAVRLDAPAHLAIGLLLVIVTVIAAAIPQAVELETSTSSLLGSTYARNLRTSTRIRGVLVAAEVAFCVCAVGAGTMTSLRLAALQRVPLGVDSEQVFALWLNLNPSKYSRDVARTQYFDAVFERARTVTGLESVGGVDLPFHFTWQTTRIRPDGQPNSISRTVLDRAATEDYLRVSGIQVLHGRWFDVRDRRGSAADVVVSQSLADDLWPASSPLGQTVRLAQKDDLADSTATVIGVVTDTRSSPHLPADRTIYRSARYAPPPWLYLLVKHNGHVSDLKTTIIDVISKVDGDVAIDGPWPVAKRLHDRTQHLRFIVLLTSVLALIGAALCATGLYGVSAYWVTASATDLSVRRAVGAANMDILTWFGTQWIAVVAPGLLVGLLMQAAVTRLLFASIEGIGEPRWLHGMIGALAVAICALCGAVGPLRRALGLDPSALLRS